jgi:hypothetical protein
MAEWVLLILLVAMVAVPVVLLFGFTGCDEVFGLDRVYEQPDGPIITEAKGAGLTSITLKWTIEATATKLWFKRTKQVQSGPPETAVTFEVGVGLPEYPDDDLTPGTYEYIAYAEYTDGEYSLDSEPVTGSTLGPPTFDAVGSAGVGTGAEAATASWSHTTSAEATAVVVGLRWSHAGNFASGNGTPTRTVTYGGSAMASLGVIGLNGAPLANFNGTFVFHEFFGLIAPPAGPQTVTATVARNNTTINLEGNSVSYRTVSAFGPVTPVAGSEAGTALTQNVNAAEYEAVVQMFTTRSGGITGYNQTVRYDSSSTGIDLVIGEAAGAITVAFTATRSTGVDYAGLAVRLLPIT